MKIYFGEKMLDRRILFSIGNSQPQKFSLTTCLGYYKLEIVNKIPFKRDIIED